MVLYRAYGESTGPHGVFVDHNRRGCRNLIGCHGRCSRGGWLGCRCERGGRHVRSCLRGRSHRRRGCDGPAGLGVGTRSGLDLLQYRSGFARTRVCQRKRTARVATDASHRWRVPWRPALDGWPPSPRRVLPAQVQWESPAAWRRSADWSVAGWLLARSPWQLRPRLLPLLQGSGHTWRRGNFAVSSRPNGCRRLVAS